MALLLTTTTLPGLLTKTSWFVTVSQTIRLSTFKSKSQATTNDSAYGKTNEKITHIESQTHKLNNQNAEKIVINRNEYSHIQSIFTGYAKITRYSVSKKTRNEQQMNTEHHKRKLK